MTRRFSPPISTSLASTIARISSWGSVVAVRSDRSDWSDKSDMSDSRAQSALEELLDGVYRHCAVHLEDAFRQRNAFGAYSHAVAGLAAALDAAFFHQRIEARPGMHLSGRVAVEQAHLRDGRRADEVAVVVHLRACLQ